MKNKRIVELKGNVFDDLKLTAVLDEITNHGATGTIKNIKIGNTHNEESYVRIVIHSENEQILDDIVEKIKVYGANPLNIFVKTVEIKGHIIDSLTLSKILDIITSNGGRAEVSDIKIGINKKDFSYAKIKIITIDEEKLDFIYKKVVQQGGVLTEN